MPVTGRPDPITLEEVYAAILLVDEHDWTLAAVARAMRRNADALAEKVRRERRKARRILPPAHNRTPTPCP